MSTCWLSFNRLITRVDLPKEINSQFNEALHARLQLGSSVRFEVGTASPFLIDCGSHQPPASVRGGRQRTRRRRTNLQSLVYRVSSYRTIQPNAIRQRWGDARFGAPLAEQHVIDVPTEKRQDGRRGRKGPTGRQVQEDLRD